MTISERPGWASTVTEPEPGVFEHWRPVARVACSDGVEEVAVSVVQRDGEATGLVFMDGRRLSGHEASLMVAALLSAMGLISNDQFEPAPVGSASGPGGQ